MTTTDADTELSTRLRAIEDRTALEQLIIGYFVSLDTRDETPLDAAWARDFLTADAEVHYPIGVHHGVETIAERLREGMNLFGPTQHLTANHLITLHGDTATLRWDAIQTHTLSDDRLWVSAGYYDAEAVRVADDWRFRRMVYTLTWSTGRPPAAPTES